MTSESDAYTGRFAPSPSGPLHFGSLLAAVASYAQALVSNGRWLVRIEDIDPPREQPGADTLILQALESFRFEWHGSVYYQSESRVRHEALLAQLMAAGKAYRCSCSRRDLADAPRGPLGIVYPGTCRDKSVSGESSIRLRVNDEPIEFVDTLQGLCRQTLESESGDFIIKRRDGLVAYHLAVVADDFDQGITEVVRGIDLLDSTPRQIFLQRQLGFYTPRYMHVPVAVDADGEKLSKATGAAPIGTGRREAELWLALRCLGQSPPDELAGDSLDSQWRWVAENWDATRLVAKTTIRPGRHGYG